MRILLTTAVLVGLYFAFKFLVRYVFVLAIAMGWLGLVLVVYGMLGLLAAFLFTVFLVVGTVVGAWASVNFQADLARPILTTAVRYLAAVVLVAAGLVTLSAVNAPTTFPALRVLFQRTWSDVLENL